MSGAVRASDGRKGARVSTPKGKRKAAPAASAGLSGANAATSIGAGDRALSVPLSFPTPEKADLAIEFLETLKIPEGKRPHRKVSS